MARIGLCYAEFDVDQAIPTVTIPPNGDDALAFNFDQPYQKTYTETLYGLKLVDYRQLPHRPSTDCQSHGSRAAGGAGWG